MKSEQLWVIRRTIGAWCGHCSGVSSSRLAYSHQFFYSQARTIALSLLALEHGASVQIPVSVWRFHKNYEKLFAASFLSRLACFGSGKKCFRFFCFSSLLNLNSKKRSAECREGKKACDAWRRRMKNGGEWKSQEKEVRTSWRQRKLSSRTLLFFLRKSERTLTSD